MGEKMRTLLLAIAGLAVSGCATIGTVQTARPIGRGAVQVGVEPSLWGVEGRGWVPAGNISARYGLTRGWDVGARVGTGGLGLSTKLALTDPRDERFAVALAPTVGSFGFRVLGIRAHSLHAQLPLLVGIGIGRRHELIVAPMIAAWQLGGRAGPSRSTVVGAGGTLGLSVRVAPNLRLLPELGLVVPVTGHANTSVGLWELDVRNGVPLYQATVGVLFGGDRR